MQEVTQQGVIVVYKSGPLNENQGFVSPILMISEDNRYNAIDRKLYPADILISRGYNEVDNAYEDEELFILKTHFKDEQKSIDAGAPRYWAKGDSVGNLPSGTMLPIFFHKLPPKETGTLPLGVTPPHGTFFIKDNEDIYGPLTSSENDENAFVIEPLTHPSLSLGKDYLGHYKEENISSCIVRSVINKKEYYFITSIKELASHKIEKIDFMSDDRLVKFFNMQGFGKNLKGLAKKEAEKLQQIISQSEKNHQTVKSERLDRLKSQLNRYLKESDIGFELIKNHLSSQVGSRFLTEYIDANKEHLLSDHIEKIKSDAKAREEQISKQISDLEKQIEIKRGDLEAIQNMVLDKRKKAIEEIEQIQKETKEQSELKLKQEQEELSHVVKEKKDELNSIQSAIDEKTKTLDLVERIENLKKECSYYESHSDKLKAVVKGFEEALNDHEKLASKMGEMEVISRVLNGGTATTPKEKTYHPVTFLSSSPTTKEDVIESICNHFEDDGGRIFSMEEMTNLVVSLNQSFMTVLSGPPGAGKTSSVIRLANALHLGQVSGNQNFLYIPVGRGWVSSRDILGFYNSLKNIYQESRTGLYDFLKKDVSLPENQSAMKLILLDEANLSSIEHYWSDFLGMCDQEGRSRPIDTGILDPKNRYLTVGSNVRFIATINNDATTERLSPRLIDRVPVISLTPSKNDPIQSGTASVQKYDGAIYYSDFKRLFEIPDDELSRSNESLLSQVIETLHKRDSEYGQSIPISHRKVMAIKNYCAVVSEIISPELAMDFAISQHILPHIEGYGSKFKKRIQDLLPLLNKSHHRSAYHVERILSGGNEFTGTYSFF